MNRYYMLIDLSYEILEDDVVLDLHGQKMVAASEYETEKIILRPVDQYVADLEAENQKLREDAVQTIINETKLLRLHYEPQDGLEVVSAGPIWRILAESIGAECDELGAENFLERTLDIRCAGGLNSFIITIQRQPDKKTPAQIVMELKEEIQEAREELQEVRDFMVTFLTDGDLMYDGFWRIRNQAGEWVDCPKWLMKRIEDRTSEEEKIKDE